MFYVYRKVYFGSIARGRVMVRMAVSARAVRAVYECEAFPTNLADAGSSLYECEAFRRNVISSLFGNCISL